MLLDHRRRSQDRVTVPDRAGRLPSVWTPELATYEIDYVRVWKYTS